MKILIAVDVTEEEHPKLALTCENCGQEIEDTEEGPPIINLKGNVPPQQFEAFRRAWYKAVNEGSHRAMIVNADIEVHRMEPSLRAAVIRHARACKKGAP